jgi:protocatechuate 3,4-dioxygenase beta subunit
MDSNCTPLNDAKIYIWQANKNGYVQYEVKHSLGRHHHQQWVDPNFTGTGVTNSDNLGRFNFTTIMPGSANKITPHIHIMVMHPKIKTLNSKIYFPKAGDSVIIDTDSDDKVFTIKEKKIIAQISALASKETDVYTVDITMSEGLKNKRY